MKIVYWIATILLSLLMLASAAFYILGYAQVAPLFVSLGFPTYIIIPLAIAKILGVVAILTGKSPFLKEWAYAGFFFDFILASSAHIHAGDGGYPAPILALILVIVSRLTWKPAA